MRRVFVYEYVTGGGLLSREPAGPSLDSLLREGSAMLEAVVADFATLSDTRVEFQRDARLESFRDARMGPTATPGIAHVVHDDAEERSCFESLSRICDFTLLIAPEIDGDLLERARTVEALGGVLLGPPSELIELASDKSRTADLLRERGVSTPRGWPLEPGEAPRGQGLLGAVLKPRFGAGSIGARRVSAMACEQSPETWRPENWRPEGWRLEEYCPGLAASVAVIQGPHGAQALTACEQILAGDGSFAYLGGRFPLSANRAARAQRLALAAAAVLPAARGYFGVDLVLGARDDGADDVVIEINPRLTTSYVGLRAGLAGNLAEAMLEIVSGRPYSFCWRPGSWEFDAAGAVWRNEPGTCSG